MVKFYKCLKCGTKVSATYLAQHWLNRHFSQMYIIVEVETQSVFELNTNTGEPELIVPKRNEPNS